MTIERADIVDFIKTEKATGIIRLTISDHLNWSREDDHLKLLKKKIATYLGFIRSGKILEHYPSAKGKKIRIDIITKYPPSDKFILLVNSIRKEIEEEGYELSYETLKQK